MGNFMVQENEEKKRILLCWGYNRASWIEHFEKIKNNFEFIYLFYYSASDEDDCYTDCKKYYFKQFSSAKEILQKLKPSKVIFMGLEGFHTIAVNMEAQRKGIPTYYMLHGSSTISLDDQKYQKRNISLLKKISAPKISNYLFLLKFICGALGLRNIFVLPKLLRLQYLKNKMAIQLALQKVQHKCRKPDFYIVYVEKDKLFLEEQDHARAEQFIVIGNPELEKYLNASVDKQEYQEKYLLYIETPISEISGHDFDIPLITREEHIELIYKINEFAKCNNWRLYIKLHHYSYKTLYFPQDDNITYYREYDNVELILNAESIIFYTTSLATPAILFKKCIMFTIGDLNFFQAGVQKNGVCVTIAHSEIMNGQLPEKYMCFREDKKGLKNFYQEFVGFDMNDEYPTLKLSKVLSS